MLQAHHGTWATAFSRADLNAAASTLLRKSAFTNQTATLDLSEVLQPGSRRLRTVISRSLSGIDLT